MNKLTKKQKQNVKKALNTDNVDILKTPEEIHQFILHWNFDDDADLLLDVAKNPNTDLGTAALLYWFILPTSEFGNPADPIAIKIRDTLKANINNDFYKNKNIAIGSEDAYGKDFLKTERFGDYIDALPERIKNGTPGEKVDSEVLETEYMNKVYPLNEDDKVKNSKAIIKAIKVLQEIDSKINEDSEPEIIIDLINQYSLSKRPKEGEPSIKFSIKQNNIFKDLDMLFGEQLVRKGMWDWYIHEMHEQVLDYRILILVSKDRQFTWDTFMESYVGWLSNSNAAEGIDVKNKFNELMNINEVAKKSYAKRLLMYKEMEDMVDIPDEEFIKTMAENEIKRTREVPMYITLRKEKTEEEILNEEIEKYKYGIRTTSLPYNVSILNVGEFGVEFIEE